MIYDIEINGRKWLMGLSWRSYENEPTDDHILDDAEDMNAQWYALRNGLNVHQAGFVGQDEEGKSKPPRKAYSLAAMLAESRRDPWLGVFKISEGLWWHIAVNDNESILPDGDVIGDAETIQRVRETHSSFMDWNVVEGNLDDIAKMLSESRGRPIPIKPISDLTADKRMLFVYVAIVLLIVGGGYGYWHHKKQVEHERMLAMQRMRNELAGKVAKKAPVSPLVRTPVPDDWLRACGKIIERLPISEYGWSPSKELCNSNNVVVTWTRMMGATVANRPDGVIENNGDTIVQTIPLSKLSNGKNNSIALEKEKIGMWAWAQKAGLVVSIGNQSSKTPLPGSTQNKKKSQPMVQVSFDTPVTPFALDLNGIPGLRLNKLISKSNGIWKLEGVLYGHL